MSFFGETVFSDGGGRQQARLVSEVMTRQVILASMVTTVCADSAGVQVCRCAGVQVGGRQVNESKTWREELWKLCMEQSEKKKETVEPGEIAP